MKLPYRFAIVAIVLGAACYGERRLESHLNARPPELPARPPILAVLPKSLGTWRGEDERLGASPPAARLPSTDEQLHRNYFQARTGQVATVHLRYTPPGASPTFTTDDLATFPADPASIESAEPFLIDSASRAPNEHSPPRGNWAFRRHYSLPIPDDPRCDALQNLGRRARLQAPTVTLEIFVPENFPTDSRATDEFVRLADTAVAEFVAAEAANVVRVPLLAAWFSQ